jgi:hypothetical protein
MLIQPTLDTLNRLKLHICSDKASAMPCIHRALVWRRPQVLASLRCHGAVQQNRHRLRQSRESIFLQQFHCVPNRDYILDKPSLGAYR